MGRKTRKQITQADKPKMTRYADGAPRWIRNLAEEVEELADILPKERLWQTPKRVQIQFSRKDAEKEEQRNEILRKRKAQRADSRR